MYPPASNPEVPPLQHIAERCGDTSEASASACLKRSHAANRPAEDLVEGTSFIETLREAVFQEFVDLLRGAKSAADGGAALRGSVELGDGNGFSSNEMHALSRAQDCWGDDFTSL